MNPQSVDPGAKAGPWLDSVVRVLRETLTLKQAQQQLERRWIQQELIQQAGNQCHTAGHLHMHRNTLARRMAALNIMTPRQAAKALASQEAETSQEVNRLRKGWRGESSEPSLGEDTLTAHLASSSNDSRAGKPARGVTSSTPERRSA